MDISKNGQKLLGLGLLAFMLCATAGRANAAPVTGAIFTTNAKSEYVNANIYDTTEDVYLNGGPRPNAPCTSAGLPDGDYYFQVTDPSGAVLLSTDDISQRKVRVTTGLMVPWNETAHSTGTGKCNFGKTPPVNITVRLAPFSTTPNPGGEYKVWITKVGDYDLTSTQSSYGFIPSKSKTDNFKVIPPPVSLDCDPTLDSDGDLLTDCEELAGKVTLPDGTVITFTPTNPLDVDTDHDGLTDYEEVMGVKLDESGNILYYFPRTDPTKYDTDGDGLSDSDEVMVYGTDPTKKDTDGDGFADSVDACPLDPNCH